MAVDLPAPFWPTRAKNSPSRTSRFMPSRARILVAGVPISPRRKCTCKFSAAMTGWAVSMTAVRQGRAPRSGNQGVRRALHSRHTILAVELLNDVRVGLVFEIPLSELCLNLRRRVARAGRDELVATARTIHQRGDAAAAVVQKERLGLGLGYDMKGRTDSLYLLQIRLLGDRLTGFHDAPVRGQEHVQRHVRVGKASGMVELDSSIRADQDCGRESRDAVRSFHLAGINSHGVMDAIFFKEVSHLRRLLVGINAEEKERVILVFIAVANQLGHFRLAGPAPGGEEVENNDSPADVF